MTTVGFIIVFVVIVVGSVGLGLALRGPVQRRLYAETGLAEWITTAKQLSWSDRIHLIRANDRGRAAKPQLAALGARRGRAVMAAVERWTSLRFLRWFWRFGILFAVLQLALNIWIVTGEDPSWINWVNLALWPLFIVLIAAQPRLQRRQLSKLRQSVQLNDVLAAQQPGRPTPPMADPGSASPGQRRSP